VTPEEVDHASRFSGFTEHVRIMSHGVPHIIDVEGENFRVVGTIEIHEPEQEVQLRLWKGATERDLRQMRLAVKRVLEGGGYARYNFAEISPGVHESKRLGFAMGPDRYLEDEQVISACTDPHCDRVGRLHFSFVDEGVEHGAAMFERDSHEVRLARFEADDLGWRVRVELERDDLTAAEVASLVSDLQWARSEVEHFNAEATRG
jgi:hypothetical protein